MAKQIIAYAGFVEDRIGITLENYPLGNDKNVILAIYKHKKVCKKCYEDCRKVKITPQP